MLTALSQGQGFSNLTGICDSVFAGQPAPFIRHHITSFIDNYLVNRQVSHLSQPTAAGTSCGSRLVAVRVKAACTPWTSARAGWAPTSKGASGTLRSCGPTMRAKDRPWRRKRPSKRKTTRLWNATKKLSWRPCNPAPIGRGRGPKSAFAADAIRRGSMWPLRRS